MRWLRVIRNWLRGDRLSRDIDEELAFHLQMREQELIEQGLPSEQARSVARRRFGNETLVKEDSRAVWTVAWVESLWADLRYGFRMLAKDRGFTVIATLSLALGIGANTTVFSILNQIRFEPLPFPDAERIVMIFEQDPTDSRSWRNLTSGKMFAMQEHSRSFEAIGQINWGQSATLAGDGFSEQIVQQIVDVNVFSIFGAQPQIGRLFEPDDVEPGRNSEGVIISDGFWQRRFGGSRDVIGRSFEVGGVKKTVIGVMPRRFWLNRQSESIALWRAKDETGRPGLRALTKFARLRDGVSIEQAQAEAEAISAEWDDTYSDSATRWGTAIVPLRKALFGRVNDSLWMLQAAVGLVLLIACVNVASMMLARGAVRQRELTVRVALGAARARIARLLLTESLLLSLLSGLAGILVALVGIRIFLALAPQDFPMLQEMRIDSDVLVFMAAICIATGLLFGLFPALRSFKRDLNSTIKEGGRDTSQGMGRRSRAALLVSEVTLAATLLGCAGLLINGLLSELRADWGYRTNSVLTASISLNGRDYWAEGSDYIKRVTPKVPLYWRSLLERVRAIPGVESVGIGSSLPTFFWAPYPVSIVGRPEVENAGRRPRASTYGVDPGFFYTLEIPLIQGRYITDQDSADALWSAVVDRTFVDRYFPNENPIGHAIRLTRISPGANAGIEEPRTREIVWVVENVREGYWVADPPARIYLSYLQSPTEYYGAQFQRTTAKTLFLKATAAAGLADSLREVVAELDPTQVLDEVQNLQSTLAGTVSRNRFYASLLGVFAAVAVFLAGVGIFGVVSLSANQRRGEFGLRMALGAQRKNILRLVLGEAILPAALGLVIGIAASFGFRRLIDSLVSGLTAVNPFTFGVIALILATTAVLAALAPARRAASIEPTRALRHE